MAPTTTEAGTVTGIERWCALLCRMCRVRTGRLAYTISLQTGVHGNIHQYTFRPIIWISSDRMRLLS